MNYVFNVIYINWHGFARICPSPGQPAVGNRPYIRTLRTCPHIHHVHYHYHHYQHYQGSLPDILNNHYRAQDRRRRSGEQ